MKDINFVTLSGSVVIRSEGHTVREIHKKDGSNTKKLWLTIRSCTGAKKKEGEQYDPANFFTFEVWDKLAQFALDYVKHGDQVTITGHLTRNEYVKDNAYVNETVLVADEIRLFGNRENAADNPVTAAAKPVAQEPVPTAPERKLNGGQNETLTQKKAQASAAPVRRFGGWKGAASQTAYKERPTEQKGYMSGDADYLD